MITSITPKQGTQPLVDPRLQTRSGIETLRRSPDEVNGEGENDPPQKGERKPNKDNAMRMKHTNLWKRLYKGYT